MHNLCFVSDDCLLWLHLLSQFESQCMHYIWNSHRPAVSTAKTSSLDWRWSALRLTPVRIANKDLQIQVKPRNYIPKTVVIIKNVSTHNYFTYSYSMHKFRKYNINWMMEKTITRRKDFSHDYTWKNSTRFFP